MKNVTIGDISNLIRGSSLLACGGGLSYPEQRSMLQEPQLLRAIKDQQLQLIEVAELPATAVIATVSEVGAADAPVMDKSLLPLALAMLEEKVSRKIAALIPGEIGQELIVIQAALQLGLPIVDCDLAGCRAVPELSDSALLAQGVSFTLSPLVVLSNNGTATLIEEQQSLEADEQRVRQLVPSGQVVTVIGGVMPASTVQTYLAYKSYSVAMKLGEVLSKKQALEQFLPTSLLLPPLAAVVTRVEEKTSQGFNEKTVYLNSAVGEVVLLVQNEYMKMNGPATFTFPQFIMVADPNFERGLHSSELVPGQAVTVLVAEALSFQKGSND